jgi:cellulose synthase/poly-beta-1,6-N-acetylglucosamine synthase-like glycosyltransferase
MNCKVTVGLCIKNAEATITETVNSILAQDFPHSQMELITVIGQSEDNTVAITEEILRGSDFVHRTFVENEGLGKAREIVANSASGDYIIWVDGDMTLSSDYVRKNVEFLDRNPSCGIARGKYGVHSNQTLVSMLENVVYVSDSEYGVKSASKVGYLPPTGGSIFRTTAIRAVGGFDTSIKGAGEDIEVAFRIKNSGWSICITDTKYYPRFRRTWTELWNQYFWYGYGGHFLLHKNSAVLDLYKMVPLAGTLAGLLRAVQYYKLDNKKAFFVLLPIHYTFKRIAWSIGYFKSHLDGYGHNSRPVS